MVRCKQDDVLKLIPKEEVDRLFSVNDRMLGNVDSTFMGFTTTYKVLAGLIPRWWTVVDLGCSYAAQSYYFAEHSKYIGVDEDDEERFCPENCVHYVKTIQDFIRDDISELDLDETFAICNYVPDDAARELVCKTFKNVYVFYPCGNFEHFLQSKVAKEGRKYGKV